MSEPVGIDPLDELRRADPVDPDRLPSASLARLEARIQEAMMQETSESRWRSRLRRRLVPALAGLAVASVALIALVGGRALTPVTAPGSSSSVGSASCVEQYSPATLSRRTFAFDGTLTAVAGDSVTFTVTQRFRGTPADEVTLTAMGMTGTTITSAGGPTLVVGDRYLVAGDDQFVWACGFTQPYDASVAAAWMKATAP